MQGLSRTSQRRPEIIHRRSEKHASALPQPVVASSDNGPSTALEAESLSSLAHDLRNVLAALGVYCELLSVPGVLSSKYGHYAQELHSISVTSAQLVERLAPASPLLPVAAEVEPEPLPLPAPARAGGKVEHIGREVLGLRPLLSAVAGPGVSLSIECLPCAGRTSLSREDLARILVNLVRNAAEAMGGTGKIRITAQYGDGRSFLNTAEGNFPEEAAQPPDSVVLAVQDNGPGIPERLREQVFAPGFSRPAGPDPAAERRNPARRGLGLSIVRLLAEAAGGTVRVVSRKRRGARLEVELPVTYGTCETAKPCELAAGSK